MFNFFNKETSRKNDDQPEQYAGWSVLLDETKERLFAFLEKLEEKMEELADAAVPELNAMKKEDEREFGNLLNGVLGQLDSVRNKAQKTYEEKVEEVYQSVDAQIDFQSSFHSRLAHFREECSDRMFNLFEEKYSAFRNLVMETEHTDYELLYQSILDEHDRIKDQFRCHQCGDTIVLTKIYFSVANLPCPACSSNNTFHPSSLARRLEEVGRGLAEQRTKPLLEKYSNEQEREREIYHQLHQLKLKAAGGQTAELKQEMDALEHLRKESKALIPVYYKEYQRAMFDEWKKLVPDLAEQTENFYQGLQNRKF